MKWFWRVLAGSGLIIAISFCVPDFSETPDVSFETLTAVSIDISGDRLLARTSRFDYEFMLPANKLIPVFVSSAGNGPLLTAQGRLYLGEIQLDRKGAASTTVTILFGGYDSHVSETKTILNDKDRQRLKNQGLSPSNWNVQGEIDPPLYMVWSTDLSGQNYPTNSRSGSREITWQGEIEPNVRVITVDPETLQRHRLFNTLLRPLTFIRDGVLYAVMSILLVTGYAALPSG